MSRLDSEGELNEELTLDGSVDLHGHPAIRAKSGRWVAGIIILLNQALATLAFCGVGVNLVLFLRRVVGQSNAEAANNVSKWAGTVYIFSLVGAFFSDSYWGRYKTCAIFQVILVIGLVSLSVSTCIFLIKPKGCGNESFKCGKHSSWEIGMFYLSIYLVGLGNGGFQPNIATFGADQFDEEHPREAHSKVAIFSYYYLAWNLGQLFSNTILAYFEDVGMWALGFLLSAGCAFLALILFLVGTPRYRHFKPGGNPLSRICQVLVAASRKSRVQMSSTGENLYDMDTSGNRKILHTHGFKFLDRAAFISSRDLEDLQRGVGYNNPWRLCPVSQVEEMKCILRLVPIWLCTIMYSVVFTQMASLFVEQGAAMRTTVSHFRIPPASMSSFNIISVAVFIFFNRRVLDPLVRRLKKKLSSSSAESDSSCKGFTELQRMGVGLVIGAMVMVSAGIVEIYRLKYARNDTSSSSSSLSIFWQIPQYALMGASEVFMCVGQLEFFNAQTPDGLKSFASALYLTSLSLGNFVSSIIVSVVMKISTKDHKPGWIPENLNKGHLDRFYFLLAALTVMDMVAYIVCAKLYKTRQLDIANPAEQNDEASI